ncbi:hypothetical protein FRC04_005103 [Tulasnella sp. 424]|nr:hypothetical protein FRC04_005103 [Tulasnella sp. 424]KAG8970379.1 hypothetical protein FRC05_000625 [Tulasnella sp. 425]
MTSHLVEKLTSFPEIPKEFGEDGGKFYKFYDELADEIDEDLVKSLKAQLDGILIFAGLFAGVNSAFLALTLPQMSANPLDDTNALLLQLVSGKNNSITIADLPSASFSPPSDIYPINVLFSMSLTLALLASFLAVLGQQWLVHYRKRSGGGAEHQRWEQLRRYLGARRWGLELVLDHILPTLLQIGLIVFCISFILFLGTLSRSISYIIAAPMGLAATVVLVLAICAAWDQWCPFKSPLSHLLHFSFPPIFILLGRIWGTCIYNCAMFLKGAEQLVYRFISRQPSSSIGRWLKGVPRSSKSIASATQKWFLAHIRRPGEDPDHLKAVALKRVICTSEDSNALIHAAINLQAYKNQDGLRQLLQDDEVHDRLRDLFHAAHRRRSDNFIRSVETKAFGNSFLYIILSVGSIPDFFSSEERVSLSAQTPDQICSEHLYKRLGDDGGRFTDVVQSFQDCSCSKCCHCAELAFWEQMIGSLVSSSLRGFLPTTYHFGFYSLSDFPEKQVPGSKDLDKWCMEKFFGVIELYRQAEDVDQMCQLVSDAVATSDSDWQYRPAVDVYVTLLSRGCTAVSNDGRHNCGTIFGSLGVLLRSIERMVRDPDTSPDDKDELREQRSRCFQIFGDEFTELGMTFPKRLEIWKAALPSLLEYMQWLEMIFEEDPGNTENHFVLKLLQRMLNTLPNIGLPPWLPPETRTEYFRVSSATSSLLSSLEAIVIVDEGQQDTGEVCFPWKAHISLFVLT